MLDDKYTRFTGWRVILRARLRAAPLTGAPDDVKVKDRCCRRCDEAQEILHPESLPTAQYWAVPMARDTEISVNQCVPWVDGDLRPYLGVLKERASKSRLRIWSSIQITGMRRCLQRGFTTKYGCYRLLDTFKQIASNKVSCKTTTYL